MNRYLNRSQAAGAQEGWIARYRTELVADNFEHISPPNREGLQKDLRVLAGNMDFYASFLADQYRRHPEIRDLLTDVLQFQSPADQQNFLGILRSAVAGP